MDAQKAFDLLVISMLDTDVINSIEKQMDYFSEFGTTEHLVVVQMLIKALENMHGNECYAKYKETGIVPSAQ